ncbi:MAG: glycoside hydrolase [Acidobacteria bacterium]|nr:MAG: glycoside hydrolase [Acidobacteriota bacterium]
MRAAVLACALPCVAFAQGGAAPGVEDVQRLFAKPPDDSRVLMRWWWFGPAVTTGEIEAEMRQMKAGGIGGFELAVVYPMALDDPARGLRNERYLSPGFLDKVAFTSRKARELGLRMDVTIGSGWSFGGPYITPDLAATRLRSDRREITPDRTSVARPVPYEGDRLIAAFVGRGSLAEVDPTSFRALDVSGAGPIALPPGEGPRLLLLYFSSPTGQVVKRAAVGAEGYVLDHYQRAAIEKHLREAGDKLLAAAGPGGIHAAFCDSLEVYGGDWTADMFSEFQKRRGYDLRGLLPRLEYDAGERSETLRRDFGRTLTELYEERFLAPMREWATRNKVLFRIQNYGEPPASLASSRYADLIDGEGWNFRTLTSARWAASAAHLFGKPVTTSETWTWLHSPAFRATPLDVKAEADQHFLSGINQLVGHGWPYSPPEAGTPGWPFYAAAVLSDKNPWWPVMPDLAAYLQRVSFLLRQGEPVADVALYAPTDDAWSTFKPGTPRYLNLFLKIVDWIGPKVVPAILDAGHGFDLVDDGTLEEAWRRRYKAIVLPGVRWMPEATRRWLADYARDGGTVLAVRRKPEGEWPSLELVSEDDLSARLARAVPADLTVTPPTPAVGFVHRRLPDADVYFLANSGNLPLDVSARFRTATPHAEQWDPRTGGVERLQAQRGEIALALEPYASRVIVFRKDARSARAARSRVVSASEDLRSGWSVRFGDTGAGDAVDLPHSWAGDPARRFFSGTATYRLTVEPPAAFRSAEGRVYLDFGEAKPMEREPLPGGTLRGNSFAALVAPPIREAATVFVNGRRAGSLWAPPYRVDVTDLLRDGANEIRVDVYNTAINQLAEGGRLPDMRPVVERYGLRTRLQDLDGLQPLPSGILSPPRLVLER